MNRRGWICFWPAAALAQQSVVETGGENARLIRELGAFFVFLLGAIFLLVIVVALACLMRRHRDGAELLEVNHRPAEAVERRLGKVVMLSASVSLLILFGLIVVSVVAGKATGGPRQTNGALAIEVTGNQWWWSVRYLNDDASRVVTTANELHIPVGRPVMIRGTSNDVIHSFWAPSLQGKRDLIPGRVNIEWIQAERPGHFRGQCAEFCGLQHAHMAFWVVAETEEEFEAWFNRQLQPGVTPVDATQARGQEVFLSSACVLCHAIQGTTAAAQVGPDLTHFGSRLSIAAGTLSNNRGNLAGWLADPQSIKPGTHMATVPIPAGDMQPLLEYLESLR